MLNSCNCLRLSKAGQEYNLLNICSCGHSFLQQAKRKIQWNRWPKIRTNLEVSNHLVSYSDLKIPHKLSQFKYMFDYMFLSQCSQFLSIWMSAEGWPKGRTDSTPWINLHLQMVLLILNFFQLLNLPDFIVRLLPSKLFVKNYESSFRSTMSTASLYPVR